VVGAGAPKEIDVNLQSAIRRLKDTTQFLSEGFSGWIDHYNDFLQDMWSEYSEQMAEIVEDYSYEDRY
jgi:hypothetical protein